MAVRQWLPYRGEAVAARLAYCCRMAATGAACLEDVDAVRRIRCVVVTVLLRD